MKPTISVFLALTQAFAQYSGANGVYGGYVGSSRWFDGMRHSAANMAILRAIGGSSARQPVPVNYSEIAGVFTFTKGNPFPGGRLPELRIEAVDKTGDGVERAPFITGQPLVFTPFSSEDANIDSPGCTTSEEGRYLRITQCP